MFQRIFIALVGIMTSACAQDNPPRILQVYRDFLKPGSDAAYRKIEEDAVQACHSFKCPHPYLAIESLTGPKEVWFFNGYNSQAEYKQIAEDYGKNSAIQAAFAQIAARKNGLVAEPIEWFANYRKELSRDPLWRLGHGRFLVITLVQTDPSDQKNNFKSKALSTGTVFETDSGIQLIISPAHTLNQAAVLTGIAGPEARVFAVRPYWSMPADEWIAADPSFWQPVHSVAKDTGSVCLGVYVPKIIQNDELKRVYVTVGESDKIFFDQLPGSIVLNHLDLHKTYIVRVFYDSKQEDSWKLRFDRLGANQVTIWRSAGYWHMDPNPDGKCTLPPEAP